MEIQIRNLTPELAEEYVRFFDVTPHDVEIDEQKCYCVTWRNDDAYSGDNDHWFPTREERRARALQYAREGSIQGYLAYRGGEVVGWCNASADCQSGVNYLRSEWPVPEYRPDTRVKSIFCFVIAPGLQRTGIATQLVDRVCRDAAGEGLDFVEAYVNRHFTDTIHEFRGPLAMYEKCGFCICGEQGDKVVVRKALKG